MTVAAKPSVATYLEDGITTVFPVPFRFKSPGDLIVERIRDDGVTILGFSVDYTVAGGATDAGGTVTRLAATAGAKLRIRRRTARTQPMVYTTGDRFPAVSHEGALDRQMLIAQEQDASLDDLGTRALQVPIGETAQILPTIPLRRNRMLAFTSTGAIAASFDVDELQRAIVNATAALAGQGVAEGVLYRQEGAYTVARSTQDRLRETYSILDYRYAIDSNWGVTIQRAIDAASARGGGTVLIPSGTYELPAIYTPAGDSLCCLILKTGVTLAGTSKHGSILKIMNAQYGIGSYSRAIVSFGLIENCGLQNFTFDGNRDGQGLYREQGNGGNIVLGYVRDCLIDNIVSKNANGQPIQISTPLPFISERIKISNCTASGASGSTVNADGTIALLYNGNGIGIQVSQFAGLIVESNFIRNCRDNGIDLFSDNGTVNPVGGNAVISNNNIAQCRVAIFPETTANCLITANYIVDCVEGGIFANRINGAPAAVRISYNQIGNVPVGVRVTGDCNPQIGVQIDHNMIYSISSTSGFGIQLGLPGANIGYVDVSYNTFGIGSNNIPLIGVLGAQAAFITGVDNHYFGTPDPGYLLFKQIGTEFTVDILNFIGVSDRSRPDLERRWGSISK